MEEMSGEVPGEMSKEYVQNLVVSKNFKNRILAYQNINQFPELVGHLQNETLAVALEVALDSLLGFAGPLDNCQVSALYAQLGHNKSSIKTKLSELIERVFLNDKYGVVRGLAELFNHKSPRVVCSCVRKVNALIRSNMEMFSSKEWKKVIAENICSNLEFLFGSTDKDVKAEATVLTVTLSHIFFDEIYKFIENVKPIILKDLKDALKDIEFPKKCITLSDLHFDHADWKERLGCMNFLKENIGRMSNASEAYPVISRKTKDVNLSVVMATVETIRNGRISHPDCIRGIVERFKDKRPALSSLIKESIMLIKPDINLIIDSLDNRNPEIKAGALECLSYYNDITRIKDIAKMLEDSSADVRSKAVDILSKIEDLSELTQSQKQRISKNKKPAPGTSKMPTTFVSHSTVLKSPVPKSVPSKAPSSSPSTSLDPTAPGTSQFDFSLDPATKNRIYESFIEKYPLFLERDWNKRLEYFREKKKAIEKEDLEDLCLFLLSCKETNIHILKEFLDILKNASEPLPYQLCSYLNSKVTEPKLRNDVVAIFRKFDQDFVARNFIHQLEVNKAGRKCVSFLETFAMLVTGPRCEIDEFLKTFKCVGIVEKKALSDLVNAYEKSKHSAFGKKPVGMKQQSICTDAEHRSTKDSTNYHSGSDNAQKPKQEPHIQMLRVDSSLKSKDCKRELVDVFTSEFLSLVEKDPLAGICLLESTDIVSLSDVVIPMYCKLDLPSPYFNSLILRYISKKYILHEQEAIALVSHLLDRRMESEMELIDRIYPTTKLYKILRESSREEGIKAILCLLSKYKGINGLKVSEVESAVKECEDFISFTIAMDKLTVLRLEMQEKFTDDITSEAIEDCFAYHVPRNTDTCWSIKSSTTKDDANDNMLQSPLGNKAKWSNEIQEDSDSLDYVENSFVIGDFGANGICLGVNESPSILRAPSVAIRDSILEDPDVIRSPSILEINPFSDIERSLDSIIATTPRKKKRNLGEVEGALSKISSEDIDVSKDALIKLNRLILENPESLLCSSNTIIGSVVAQLMRMYDNQEIRSISLSVLLRFTQNVSHCSSLRYETLRSIHTDLISIVKENNTVADILINLCLNCNVQLLRVYLDLLENSNEILMKLIWRHSKRVDYSSIETVAMIMMIIDSFYTTKRDILFQGENVLLKVCLLHLKECVSSFSDNVKEFKIGRITGSIVDLLVGSRDLSLDKIRECFKQ